MSDKLNKGKKTTSPGRHGRGSSGIKVGKRVVAKISGNKMAERVKQQKYRMYRSMTPVELHEEWVKSNIDRQIIKAVNVGAIDAVKKYAESLSKPSSKPSQNVKDVIPQRESPIPKMPVKGQDIRAMAAKLRTARPQSKQSVKQQDVKDVTGSIIMPKSFKEIKENIIKKAISKAIAKKGAIGAAVGGAIGALLPFPGGAAVGSAIGSTIGDKVSSNKEEPVDTSDQATKSYAANGGDIETIVRANVEKIKNNKFMDKSFQDEPTLQKPMVSEAQRAYLHIHHPDIAEEFESKTPKNKKLPYKVKKD